LLGAAAKTYILTLFVLVQWLVAERARQRGAAPRVNARVAAARVELAPGTPTAGAVVAETALERPGAALVAARLRTQREHGAQHRVVAGIGKHVQAEPATGKLAAFVEELAQRCIAQHHIKLGLRVVGDAVRLVDTHADVLNVCAKEAGLLQHAEQAIGAHARVELQAGLDALAAALGIHMHGHNNGVHALPFAGG